MGALCFCQYWFCEAQAHLIMRFFYEEQSYYKVNDLCRSQGEKLTLFQKQSVMHKRYIYSEYYLKVTRAQFHSAAKHKNLLSMKFFP